MKKKIITLLFVLLGTGLFLFPAITRAELTNPLAGVTGAGTTDPKIMIVKLGANILNYLLAAVGGLALIFIIVGGIMYMLSTGSEERMTQAKKVVISSVMGLAIVIGATLLLTEIFTTLGGTAGSTTSLFTVVAPFTATSTTTLTTVTGKIISLLLTSLGMLGVIGIVLGGVWYLTSGGNEDRSTLGKKTLIYSILGLAVAIGSLIIVKQVGALFS